MAVQGFIFDMDGTLIDSEVVWVEAVRQAYAAKGCVMSAQEAGRLVYGKGWHDIYEEVRRKFPDAYPDIAALEKVTHAFFEQARASGDIVIHGSVRLLRRLLVEYPVAVVSGSNRRTVRACLEELGVLGKVRGYLGTEDYAPGKPAPNGFLRGAQLLGLPPAACLVFEDSTAGVQAAKAAGMVCVALSLPGHPRQDLTLADEVLDDLSAFRVARYTSRAGG